MLLHMSCIHFGADETFVSTMAHIASKNFACSSGGSFLCRKAESPWLCGGCLKDGGGLEAWFLDFSSLYKVKEDTLRTW